MRAEGAPNSGSAIVAPPPQTTRDAHAVPPRNAAQRRAPNCAPQPTCSRVDWFRRHAAGGRPNSRRNARLKAVSV